jgi:hypothetical protein
LTDGPSTGRHVFVVRLWEEASADRPKQLRGSVEHVRSGRRMYFARLEDLQAIIQQALQQEDALKGTTSGGDHS